MSDWEFLNRHRVRPKHDPIFGTNEDAGFNGLFQMMLNGLRIQCIASDGMGWKHVSVTIHGSTIPPSWSVMCKVKDLFWDDSDWVVQFHPAKDQYVNNHPGCLHLWQPLTSELPKPDPIFLGVRNQEDVDRINSDPTSVIKFETV